jgi:hypothetical protein
MKTNIFESNFKIPVYFVHKMCHQRIKYEPFPVLRAHTKQQESQRWLLHQYNHNWTTHNYQTTTVQYTVRTVVMWPSRATRSWRIALSIIIPPMIRLRMTGLVFHAPHICWRAVCFTHSIRFFHSGRVLVSCEATGGLHVCVGLSLAFILSAILRDI